MRSIKIGNKVLRTMRISFAGSVACAAAVSLMAISLCDAFDQPPSQAAPQGPPIAGDPFAVEEPPVVIEPAEELPVPGGNADSKAEVDSKSLEKQAPNRSKQPIVITPRNPLNLTPKSTLAPKATAEVFEEDPLVQTEPAQGPQGGGYLGLVVEPAQGGGFGLSVVDVTTQSPAWKAGFRVGDRIVGVGGQAVTTLDQFGEQLERYATGTPVKFLVQRRGRSTNLTAVLQDRTLAGQIQGMQPGTALPLAPPKTPYQPILPKLTESAKVRSSDPGLESTSGGVMLGVSVSDLSETFRRQFGIPLYRGAAVSNVTPGTTAELAGLQPGDCISEINGAMILRAQDVIAAVQQVAVGESITIGYYRGKQQQLVEVPLLTEGMIAGQSETVHGAAGNPESISPEYVQSLRAEIRRLEAQLARMQARLDQLETAR